MSELEIRELSIEYTVRYFKNKPQVAEDIFLSHLEKIYNFLKNGSIEI